MEVDSTSIEEVTSIPWVESMEKEMVPKRVIIVGYNGPTKRNVIPERMLKDIKDSLRIIMALIAHYILELYQIDEMFT
jgi:hypothetical protein